MAKTNRWLTVKTALAGKPGLLLVNSVGLHLFRREATTACAKHTGRTWKQLYREGWRVVAVNVREVSDG